MNQQPEQPSVRRIVLPSGRSIEVVRWGDQTHPPAGCTCAPTAPPSSCSRSTGPRLRTSPGTSLLNCPNCDWYTEGVYTQDQVRELEDRLDEGLADMLRDLQRLTQANMADQIDRFITALNADQILPEDF